MNKKWRPPGSLSFRKSSSRPSCGHIIEAIVDINGISSSSEVRIYIYIYVFPNIFLTYVSIYVWWSHKFLSQWTWTRPRTSSSWRSWQRARSCSRITLIFLHVSNLKTGRKVNHVVCQNEISYFRRHEHKLKRCLKSIAGPLGSWHHRVFSADAEQHVTGDV